MSLYSYNQSLEIAKHDYDFDALLMAAMRKADTYNTFALQLAFPNIWNELQERYNAPGGILDIDG